jgi:hypothetical protein
VKRSHFEREAVLMLFVPAALIAVGLAAALLGSRLVGAGGAGGEPAFVPARNVAGIGLRDRASARSVLGDSTCEHEQLDVIHGGHVLSNVHGDEFLTLVHFPGDDCASFSRLAVSRSRPRGVRVRSSTVSSFETDQGIRLGPARSSLRERLGAPSEERESGDRVVLSFVLKGPAHELLREHRVPAYRASYTIADDELIEFEIGFEEP